MPSTPRYETSECPSPGGPGKAASKRAQPAEPPRQCQPSEASILIPQGSAGCLRAVTTVGRLHRVQAHVHGGEELAPLIGAGEASAPMKTAGGAHLVLFGPWERDAYLIVRCEWSENGGRTWRGAATRYTAADEPGGEAGHGGESRTVTIRSDDGCSCGTGSGRPAGGYNDAITTVCFAPQAFSRPPGAGQQPVFVPIGYSAALACVAESRARQRFSVCDARGRLLARFDDDCKDAGGCGGSAKRPMSSGGQRTAVLGPWERHVWLVTACEWSRDGSLRGWNPSESSANIRMNGSKIAYTIRGDDGGDSKADSVVATCTLAAV